jgi:hypothetical protein
MKGTRHTMNQLRTYRAIVVAVVLLVLGQALSLPMSVAASAGAPPTVPEAIAVPVGSVLLFNRHARGAQIYECQSGEWTLHAPRALLFDPESNQPDGIHYGGIDRGLTPGPWWESLDDGSRIRGVKTGEAVSPNPSSIPLLRLKVIEHRGEGVFSPVSYIQRLNTTGGISPSGGCEPGAQRQVPYTSDYYFYASP